MNGYAIFGQPPVFPSIRSDIDTIATAESDAQRCDRLAQEVGRLNAELSALRGQLDYALNGDAHSASKVGGQPIGVTIDGVDMTVMLVNDDPDSDPYADSVWTGQGWMWSESLSEDFKEAATKAALAQLEQDAQP